MIIRSQDKKSIVNINNVDTITINECRIQYYNGVSDSRGFLGSYSAEEKAIKVLDMIQEVYTQYAALKKGLGVIQNAFVLPKCVEMPQDDEV